MATLLETVGNRIFDKITLNPARNLLHTFLINDIKNYSEKFEIAADISSSHFANAEYFQSDNYIGVDIDRGRLVKGKARFEDVPEYVGLQADIRKPIFQTNSIGIVVCTHTLHHLDSEEHLEMVDLLLEYISPGGCLLIQVADDSPTDEINEKLEKEFNSVKRVDYYNYFTKLFVNWHASCGKQYNKKITMTGWRRYLNAAAITTLSLFEYLSWPNPSYTYFRCLDKRQCSNKDE